MVQILETDGLLYVRVASDRHFIAPLIALVSSARMFSTLVKAVGVRILMAAYHAWLVGSGLCTIGIHMADGLDSLVTTTLLYAGQVA
jgi:hypothetical protein